MTEINKTVLLTGAAGDIGTRLRPLLLSCYSRIILSDLQEITDLADRESFQKADLVDKNAMDDICKGVDAIVHLGGQSVEGDWNTVNHCNIQGMFTLMEAAHQAGVERLVFASSNHAIGMYSRNRRICVDSKVRPDSRYGLSKAFGEALCSLYADKHGMRCLSIRIGNVADKPLDLRRLSMWIHIEDLFQLIQIGVEHPDLHNEIVFGCSQNDRSFWDNGPAFRLGYRPGHKAEDHVVHAMTNQKETGPDAIGDNFQGGTFSSAEFDGDLDRIRWS